MAIHIGRRKFIATLSGAAAAWPLTARAQQPGGIRRVGVLMNLAADDSEAQARNAAFLQGLSSDRISIHRPMWRRRAPQFRMVLGAGPVDGPNASRLTPPRCLPALPCGGSGVQCSSRLQTEILSSPLGISTLRNRVCMTPAMLVLEPIFEADLPPEQ
jgi:hypothetical protein